jgi:hypothetical protein
MGIAPPRIAPAAPSSESGAPAEPAGDGPQRVRPWRLLIAGCLALAALTLLTYTQPTYDPYAWLLWGRQITELDLDTMHGPSWKPLPILFTTPFALAGDAAPELWVWIARAGGLLAIAMAYRLASRLAGRVAGVVAAAALLLAGDFARWFAGGGSEGLFAALGLWAVERHLDGRRADAFALGFATALLRPEIWPFWALYGVWLAREPGRRVLVGGLFAANAFLWLAPEWWGSGNPFRAAERAQSANPGEPVHADFPFLEALDQFAEVVGVVVLAGFAAAVALAWRARRRVELALAAGAVALVAEVALMAEAGFAGNVRYATLAVGVFCVLAGVGLARLHPAVVPVALAAIAAMAAGPIRGDLRGLEEEAVLYDALPAAIARAGGAEEARRCGRLFTTPFQVQALAWHLHVSGREVSTSPRPPGTIFAPRATRMAGDERFAKVAETAEWTVRRDCAS